MPNLETNKNLQDYHAFAVPWRANFFCVVKKTQEAIKIIQYAFEKKIALFILGGGSNILPIKNFAGLVVKNEITGRKIISENEKSIILDVGSGECWHDLVVWCTENGYYGLENLALIPGTVAGAVVQNIGAYDVDLQRFIQSVEVINIQTGEKQSMDHAECQFSYRSSIFKVDSKKYLIVSTTIQLSKKFIAILTYKSLKEELSGPISQYSAIDVMNAVIQIRRSKLPNLDIIGTAGSFFANPRLSDKEIKKLKRKYPNIPVYKNYGTEENTVAAGWLIENSNLDKSIRNNFLYEKHALVLVNKLKGQKDMPQKYGKQIWHASKMIANRVKKDFKISLVPEVVILGQ